AARAGLRGGARTAGPWLADPRGRRAQMSDLQARLVEIIRATPTTLQVLRTVRDLDLPDGMVFSGAVYQPVWNHLTGRAPDYGIKDYDVAYHDESDISYE